MHIHFYLYQHLKDTQNKLPPGRGSGWKGRLREKIFTVCPYIQVVPKNVYTYFE